MKKYTYSRKALAELFEQKKVQYKQCKEQAKADITKFVISTFSLGHNPTARKIVEDRLTSTFFSPYNAKLASFRQQHKPTRELFKQKWFQDNFFFEISDDHSETGAPPQIPGKFSFVFFYRNYYERLQILFSLRS